MKGGPPNVGKQIPSKLEKRIAGTISRVHRNKTGFELYSGNTRLACALQR
jgi:hypothetical protein